MKSFAVKAAIVILFCFIIKIALPYAVDPHNVFHTDNIRNYGVEPNANYIKMTYILNNKDKFNAFMFGSSRVGSIHTDKIPGVRCYNMNYAFGKPSEFLANINTFLENGIVPERIYLGLDVSSYAVDSSDHLTSTQCMPYEYAKENPEVFFNAYFDPLMVLRSLPLIFEGKGMDGYRVFYTNGCRIDYDEEGGGWDTTMRHYAGECDDPETAIAEALSVIREIKELCEENGIEIVVFTNPMYRSTYEASVEMDYYGFLRGLSEVTDYYNFSGLNALTTDAGYFLEASHCTAALGDLVRESMISGNTDPELLGEGFGVYVTADNADSLIDTLKNNDIKYGGA